MSLSPEGKTWEQYFADLKVPGGNGVVEVAPVKTTVLDREVNPTPFGLGASVKKVLTAVELWPSKYLLRTRIHLTDEFYAADSKKKPGQEAPDHRKGDLKKPAHEQIHWWVIGAHRELRLWFQAHWQEGVTPKGGRSFKFVGARAHDPVGMPTELLVDYSLGDSAVARIKDEPDWAYQERVRRLYEQADERDRAYNDGKSYLNRRPLFTGAGAAGRFEQWLTEANEMVTRVADRKEAA